MNAFSISQYKDDNELWKDFFKGREEMNTKNVSKNSTWHYNQKWYSQETLYIAIKPKNQDNKKII